MEALKNAASRIYALPPLGNKTNNLLQTFPQFSRLPPETRYQIWIFSLESRIIPLHLHRHYQNTIEREPQIELDPNESDSYGSDNTRSTYTLSILTCTLPGQICDCTDRPPTSPHNVPLPAAFFVCHESRAATRKLYSKFLDDGYEEDGSPTYAKVALELAQHYRGSPLGIVQIQRNPFLWKRATTRPYPFRTGVVANPWVDVLMVNALIRIRDELSVTIAEFKHLVAVIAREMPDLAQIVVRVSLPSEWQSRESLHFWRTLGQGGRWVSQNLLRIRGLKEVVILTDNSSNQHFILPQESQERASIMWKEKLEKSRENWPREWLGSAPVLKFVNRFEDLRV